MALPVFFYNGALTESAELTIGEETAKHIVQVLRMQAGEQLQLTNGKGSMAVSTILKAEKKRCTVHIDTSNFFPENPVKLHLCVAFTKNTSRNEWLLEKATELGVSSIIPLVTTRSERERFRFDRWQHILISALIQSQQYYLPHLSEAVSLREILQRFNHVPQKLIGHCMEGFPKESFPTAMKAGLETVVLIGPEGDFTGEEVNLCHEQGFTAVTLGTQRLRTETAAMAACAYFNLLNNTGSLQP